MTLPSTESRLIGANLKRYRVVLVRMQVELLDRRRWRTRVELANAMFAYLEIFH